MVATAQSVEGWWYLHLVLRYRYAVEKMQTYLNELVSGLF
jgi:hypothetical protein